MAVAFDAVGPSSAGTGATGTTLSWSHTCSGSNRFLVVAVAVGIIGDTGITTTATYNSVSMTSVAKIHTNNASDGYLELFYLVAPATGSNTVAITCSTTVTLTGGSVSFTGVDQTTPFTTPAPTSFGDSTAPSLNVTSTSGNMVVDGLAAGTGISATGQTSRWLNNFSSSSGAGNAAQSTAAGAGSVTMSYTIGTDFWAMIGLDVKAAPDVPVVTTQAVTSVGPTTATGNGTVVADGGDTITERGVCWSTAENPTTADSKATAAGTVGSYSASITGLSDVTQYHVRAYAINSAGTSYGNDVTFIDYPVSLSWIQI